jgi:hypothetical protein
MKNSILSTLSVSYTLVAIQHCACPCQLSCRFTQALIHWILNQPFCGFVGKCFECIQCVLFLKLRCGNHLFQQRKCLSDVFLETGELKDYVEVILLANRMEDVESCGVVGELRGEFIVGVVLGGDDSVEVVDP